MDEKNNNVIENPINVAISEDMEIAERRERFESQMLTQNLWGHSELGLQANRAAMTMLSTKTGMFAKIPLICKADNCPYSETCSLLPYELAPFGEYCPMETAQIELRAREYLKDFNLDMSSFTDKNLTNDIISLDIMIDRCKALMSKEGTPVIDVVAGITERGVEIIQPSVSKSWEAYERMLKRRNELYQLMMATKRDKNKDKKDDSTDSISMVMAEISSEDFAVVEEAPKGLKGDEK